MGKVYSATLLSGFPVLTGKMAIANITGAEASRIRLTHCGAPGHLSGDLLLSHCIGISFLSEQKDPSLKRSIDEFKNICQEAFQSQVFY